MNWISVYFRPPLADLKDSTGVQISVINDRALIRSVLGCDSLVCSEEDRYSHFNHSNPCCMLFVNYRAVYADRSMLNQRPKLILCGKGSTQNGPSDFFLVFHPRILVFPKSTTVYTHTPKVWWQSHKPIKSVMPV